MCFTAGMAGMFQNGYVVSSFVYIGGIICFWRSKYRFRCAL